MAEQFVKQGEVVLAHSVMVGTDEGDTIIIAAPSPEALKRAFEDLIETRLSPASVRHIAMCDAELAGLLGTTDTKEKN